MQYRRMSEVDLKLALLGGDSIDVENLEIVPYTLREIRQYGYTRYNKNLQWILLSVDDFIDSVKDFQKRQVLEMQRSKLTAFDFYINFGGDELRASFLNAISMIFRTDDVRILEDRGVVAIDFIKMGILKYDKEEEDYVPNLEVLESIKEDDLKIIHRDNYNDIVEVVKIQNYLEKPNKKEDDFNPANDEVAKLKAHMDKMRKKVEEAKKQQKGDSESEIDIADIVSAVSSKSNSINKLNIWDFTLYQVYDEYARLELIDNYDFSIKAMMAGAEKIDLKHWSSKLH